MNMPGRPLALVPEILDELDRTIRFRGADKRLHPQHPKPVRTLPCAVSHLAYASCRCPESRDNSEPYSNGCQALSLARRRRLAQGHMRTADDVWDRLDIG